MNETVKPIDYPILETTEERWYKCFKYKSKKPGNVVSEYIKHYTDPNEVVLDPFAGSGVTAIEAIIAGRKAIAFDLNPVATLITKAILRPVNLDDFKEEFQNISNDIRDELLSLYETKCRKCGKQVITVATARDRDAKDVKDELYDVRYYCRSCKTKAIEVPTTADIRKLEDIRQRIETSQPNVPKGNLQYSDGRLFEKAEKITSIPNLFTERNLLALAILKDRINSISKPVLRELMLFAFSTILHLGGKLGPVRSSRPYSTHWGRDTGFWVPAKYMEQNIWILFERAVLGRQGVLPAKKAISKRIPYYKEAKKFDDLLGDANALISTTSVFDLNDALPDESVDYIFTDPPYGGAVQYGEIGTLHASWLDCEIKYQEELTINKQQNKDFEIYYNMLHSSFRRMFQVLKDNRWMTVTFHHTAVKIFNAVLRAPRYSGFGLLSSPVYQMPLRAGVKALAQPYGSATGDYYISYFRPSTPTKVVDISLSVERQKRLIVDAVKEIIAKRGEPTSFTDILRGIHSKLSQHGYVPIDEAEAVSVLKEFTDVEFTQEPLLDGKGGSLGQLWWLKNPDTVKHLSRIPLEERVEQAVIRILKRETKVTFDQVLQEIYQIYTNAMTPDPLSVRLSLAQYAQKSKDGKWILSPTFDKYESDHSRLIAYLAELGTKAGYEIWIGKREQGDSFGEIQLKDLITSTNIDSSYNIPEVSNIDVLWIKENRIRFEFEVENSTTITEAIERGNSIPDSEVERFIVIPRKRISLIQRKLGNSWTGQKIRKAGWKFIFYEKLEAFYHENEKEKSIDAKEIRDLTSEEYSLTQTTILDF